MIKTLKQIYFSDKQPLNLQSQLPESKPRTSKQDKHIISKHVKPATSYRDLADQIKDCENLMEKERIYNLLGLLGDMKQKGLPLAPYEVPCAKKNRREGV